MNLIEALKSGKRFKRPGWDHWRSVDETHQAFYQVDILADDWTIEPVTVTRSQVEKAFSESVWSGLTSALELREDVLKRLGL